MLKNENLSHYKRWSKTDAEDDQEFWVNPTNQGQQLTFKDMKFKDNQTPKSYGGNISREELAKHYKKTDCWTALDGKVYDITKYI